MIVVINKEVNNNTPTVYLRNDLYNQIVENKDNVTEYVNNSIATSLATTSSQPKHKRAKQSKAVEPENEARLTS